MQHRLDGTGHGVLVVERHGGERAGRGRARPVFLHRAHPPELAAMGQHHPLGAPGRARGVGQEGHRIGADLGRLEAVRLGHERSLVGLPAERHRVEGEARGDPGVLDHLGDGRVAGRLDHRGAAAGILDDIGQGLVAELGVERHRHDAGAHRAIHDLDELEAVVDRHRHAVAGLEPRRHDQVGETVEPLLQLAIGDDLLPIAAKVDHRDRVRIAGGRRAAPIAQIVVRVRHRPSRSSAGKL